MLRLFRLCSSSRAVFPFFRPYCQQAYNIGETVEEISRLVQSNVATPAKTGSFNIHTGNFSRVLTYLLEQNFAPSELVEKFSESPEPANRDVQQWTRTVKTLLQLNFNTDQITKIIFRVPMLLGTSPTRLWIPFDTIQSIGLKTDKLVELFTRAPELLLVSKSMIEDRVAWFRAVFPNRDVIKICLRSPAILVRPTAEQELKVAYILVRMGLEQEGMLNCDLWSHSLLHLRIRHEFLERIGKYAKPSYKNRNMSNNPSMSDMVDTDNKYFAESVAEMPLKEYKVFVQFAVADEGFLKEWNEPTTSDAEEEEEDLSDDD